MRRQRPRARYLNRTAVRRALGILAAGLLVAIAAWKVAHAEATAIASSPASIVIEGEA